MRIEQSEFHDHLVRGLTHKMNNILSLFHGYLGLLMDDKNLDRNTLAGLNRIRESADTAAKLMDRTKALAPPTNAVWRHVTVENFIRTLTPSLQLYTERGVQIETDSADDLPDLWTDTSRLRIALKEIVKNACEAAPQKSTVEITARPHSAPMRVRGRRPTSPSIAWICIAISDTGPGIPADLTSKVFQPFFTTKTKRESMGLGLSVAIGLIQQLGGAIRLQSKPGRTAVKVLLPSRTLVPVK
jgi:nitrogen-specific signal transduction histidine kinase